MTNTIAAQQDTIEAVFGADYFMAEERGIRYLSERDFPIAEAVEAEVSDADWDFFAEAFYGDPMERDF